MLFFKTLFCLFSANLVASQFAKPGILADSGSGTALKPMGGGLQSQDSSDDLHVIRELLKSRQSGCPTGYGECTNPAGRCCPTSGSCCDTDGCCEAGYFCYSTGCCPTGTNGCQGNSCCTASETCCSGGGCCEAGYVCAVVNGQRGCCPTGKTCTSVSQECEDPGYVVCTGQDFCCPPGYTCYRDSAGNPKCSLGGNTSIPPSLGSSGGAGPSATFLGTSTTKGPSTASIPKPSTSSTSSPTPSPSSNSNSNTNNGATSSAISVVVDAILASFASVGVFAYLL